MEMCHMFHEFLWCESTGIEGSGISAALRRGAYSSQESQQPITDGQRGPPGSSSSVLESWSPNRTWSLFSSPKNQFTTYNFQGWSHSLFFPLQVRLHLVVAVADKGRCWDRWFQAWTAAREAHTLRNLEDGHSEVRAEHSIRWTQVKINSCHF